MVQLRGFAQSDCSCCTFLVTAARLEGQEASKTKLGYLRKGLQVREKAHLIRARTFMVYTGGALGAF